MAGVGTVSLRSVCVCDQFLLTSSVDSRLHFAFHRIHAHYTIFLIMMRHQRQPRLCQQCHENRTQFLNLKLHTHAIQSARIFLLVPRFTSFFAAIFHAGVFCSVRSFWFAFPAEAAHAIHTNRFHFHSIHILHFVCRFYFIRWLPSARIHFMMMIYVCEADRRRRTRKKNRSNQRLHNLLSLSHALVTHCNAILTAHFESDRMDTGLISLFTFHKNHVHTFPAARRPSRVDSIEAAARPERTNKIKRINI